MKSPFTVTCQWLLPLLLLLHQSAPSVASADIPTISSLNDLPYDTNDHLVTHVFAYPARCSESLRDSRLFNGIFHHAFYALTDDAERRVFGHFSSEADTDANCMAVCLEKGTLKSVVARPLPHRYWNGGQVDRDGDGTHVVQMDLMDFMYSDGCGKVEYGMVNYHERVSESIVMLFDGLSFVGKT